MGFEVLFWNDKWCSDEKLEGSFPSLFNIAMDKDCLVSSVLQIEGGQDHSC